MQKRLPHPTIFFLWKSCTCEICETPYDRIWVLQPLCNSPCSRRTLPKEATRH